MQQQRDFILSSITLYGTQLGRLTFVPADSWELPEIFPGQFAQILTRAQGVTLRRPISVCDVIGNELHMFIRNAGRGTDWLLSQPVGTIVNMLLPLGNGFTMLGEGKRVLLVGGGAGAAPLLYAAKKLKSLGATVDMIIGAKTRADFVLTDEFEAQGKVTYTTEDGSLGIKGFVTASPMITYDYDMVSCCGPTPMMKAVARVVKGECEVSLENMMGCGIGACLCCVEKTVKGNVCVCKQGPVFNTKELLWQN